MAGEADAISKPAGKLPGRVEPLKDFYPGGDVRRPVQAFEHLMAAGKEIALAPAFLGLETHLASAGAIRGIPFAWRLIDCSFGVFGCVPLLVCWRSIKEIERA